MRSTRVLLLLGSLWLAGCEQLGIETPAVAATKREADAKAVGGACRHAGRAIEDCYTLNKKAEKAAVYAGWREMNDYMRENQLEPVAPVIKPEPPVKKAKADDEDELADDDPADKGGKGGGKGASGDKAGNKASRH